MKYNNDEIAAYGAVEAFGTTYEITDSRYPHAGEAASRAGAYSSDLVGMVVSPSVTVTADGVVLKNMIMTDLCSMGGDSGGPMWNGDADCRSSTANERTVYQPVHWVLANYGLEAF